MTNILQEYYELREKRLALQHEADRIEQMEKDILYEITKELNPANTYSAQDNGFVMRATPKDVPQVTKWEDVLKYIREESALDLLQRRLTESAVKTRWDNGVLIPGIEKVNRWSVIISKSIP